MGTLDIWSTDFFYLIDVFFALQRLYGQIRAKTRRAVLVRRHRVLWSSRRTFMFRIRCRRWDENNVSYT